jgi:hypothetical protein
MSEATQSTSQSAVASRDWRRAHASKLTSAAQAIARIRPGRRILIGSGAAEPVRLVEALVRDGQHLFDNEIVHLLTLGPAPYVRAELASRFRHSAFFIGPNVRDAVQDGRADFIPVFLSEIPELIRSQRVRIDVAVIQTSVPDVPVSLWTGARAPRPPVPAFRRRLLLVPHAAPRRRVHSAGIERLPSVGHELVDGAIWISSEAPKHVG